MRDVKTLHQLSRKQKDDTPTSAEQVQLLVGDGGVVFQLVAQNPMLSNVPSKEEEVLEVLTPFSGVTCIHNQYIIFSRGSCAGARRSQEKGLNSNHELTHSFATKNRTALSL